MQRPWLNHFRVELVGWRRQMGLSQDEAAELLGVDQKTVQRWEAGVMAPPFKRYREILKTFEETLARKREQERLSG